MCRRNGWGMHGVQTFKRSGAELLRRTAEENCWGELLKIQSLSFRHADDARNPVKSIRCHSLRPARYVSSMLHGKIWLHKISAKNSFLIHFAPLFNKVLTFDGLLHDLFKQSDSLNTADSCSRPEFFSCSKNCFRSIRMFSLNFKFSLN